MHVLPDERRRDTHGRVLDWTRERRGFQARIVNLISKLFNYQGPGDTPSVTEALMREGDVGVVLSVLYSPLDEMDLDRAYGAPPAEGYFADVLGELELVEAHVAQTGEAAM